MRAARLPGAKWRLLWEALFALLIARASIAFLPFRRIAGWLGTPGVETSHTAPPEEIRIAQEIGWAVCVVARRVTGAPDHQRFQAFTTFARRRP